MVAALTLNERIIFELYFPLLAHRTSCLITAKVLLPSILRISTYLYFLCSISWCVALIYTFSVRTAEMTGRTAMWWFTRTLDLGDPCRYQVRKGKELRTWGENGGREWKSCGKSGMEEKETVKQR
jgi:hypothetical protein